MVSLTARIAVQKAHMRVLAVFIAATLALQAQAPATAPVFENGLAQPVFAGQPIVRHNVWVEVHTRDSVLQLPVVGGDAAFAAAIGHR